MTTTTKIEDSHAPLFLSTSIASCKCGGCGTNVYHELRVEESCAIIGEYKNGMWGVTFDNIRGVDRGSQNSVEFDWEEAVNREDTQHSLQGWHHTHPMGFKDLSSRDIQTMNAWTFYLGKPLICAISTVHGTKAWIFDPEQPYPEPLDMTEFGKLVIMERQANIWGNPDMKAYWENATDEIVI